MRNAWLVIGSALWFTGCSAAPGKAAGDRPQPATGDDSLADSGDHGHDDGPPARDGGERASDGSLGQDPQRDAGAQADGSSGSATSSSCDLSGTWAAQRVSFANVDNPLVPGAQKNSTWYFFEVTQQGDAFTIARGMWCGETTTGDATINFSTGTTNAIREHMEVGGRRGIYRVSGAACALELERTYTVTGVRSAATYLPGAVLPPGRIESLPELASLPPLPTKLSDPAAEDWDGDGKAGVQYIITDSPLGSGIRHAVQRAWNAAAGETPQAADDFRIPATYDFEEVALEAVPVLFASTAVPRKGAPNQMRWKRVAKDFEQSDAASTCRAVRELLPHAPLPRDAF